MREKTGMIKYLIVAGLEKLCSLTHELPDIHDENLQKLFIRVFGYPCPFVIWSFHLDEKWKTGFWKEEELLECCGILERERNNGE